MRTGLCMIRVGGNTQETAKVIYDTIPNGRVMEKNVTGVTNPVRVSLSIVSFAILVNLYV
jgi:hypothetical protein